MMTNMAGFSDDWVDYKRVTNVCQSAWWDEGYMEGGNIANPQVRVRQVRLQGSGLRRRIRIKDQ